MINYSDSILKITDHIFNNSDDGIYPIIFVYHLLDFNNELWMNNIVINNRIYRWLTNLNINYVEAGLINHLLMNHE